MNLADALVAAFSTSGQVSMATGAVTALAGAKVAVTVAGATLTLPRLARYSTPTVGDVVIVLTSPGGWVVLDKIATS